jgi:hypothetical protein
MYMSQAQHGQHFRHWVNTWDDIWVRVRCSDGSEFGEWLSAALQNTPSKDRDGTKRCADDLVREAKTLRQNDRYRDRSWCDYVDLPWQTTSRQ